MLDLSFTSISATDDVKATDTQSFAVGGSPPPPTPGNGSFNVTSTYPGTSTLSYSSFVSTSAVTRSCSIPPTVVCNVQDGTASSGLSFANTMRLDVGSYNNQTVDAAVATPALTGCTYAGTTTPLSSWPIKNSDGTTQTYLSHSCKNYQVTAVSSPNGGAYPTADAHGLVTLSSVGLADGRVLPLPGEVTRITFPGIINSGETVTVTLGLQSTTPQTPTSCTYTCGQEQGFDCKSNKPTNFSAVVPACP